MTAKQFEDKVAKMRLLQKEYFKTREVLTLRAAKKAEKEVDVYLEQLGKPGTPTPPSSDVSQQTLF